VNKRLGLWMCAAVAAMLTAILPTPGRQTRDSASVRRQFVGTWKLVSTAEKLKDGSVRPYNEVGAKGAGYLMYSAEGTMCAELMKSERPKWDDPPTAEQKIAAIEGFTAYCGRFEIDPIKQVMWHYPDLAWKPNYVGTKQARPYRFEGGRLIFSDQVSPVDKDDVVQWTIVWEKVK
jgi:hypothetical protein